MAVAKVIKYNKVNKSEPARHSEDVLIRLPKEVSLMDAYNAFAGMDPDFLKDGRDMRPPKPIKGW